MRTIFLILIFLPQFSKADEPKAWKHESEASVVTTTGNSETETYSGKQNTSYTFTHNVIVVAGSYLSTKTSGTETAKTWDASLRYERELSELWSAYAQLGTESNPYGGILQRDNSDVGGKYFLNKAEKRETFVELGARSARTNWQDSKTLGRIYVEYNQPVSDTVDFKIGEEYLRDVNDPQDYRSNFNTALSVALNRIFSMRLTYLVKTDNSVVAPAKTTDTNTTVSLVAKF